jgi:hypothetical protein
MLDGDRSCSTRLLSVVSVYPSRFSRALRLDSRYFAVRVSRKVHLTLSSAMRFDVSSRLYSLLGSW